jgi:hypothetical protein
MGAASSAAWHSMSRSSAMALVDQPQVQPPPFARVPQQRVPARARVCDAVDPVAILTFQLASYEDESRLCKRA